MIIARTAQLSYFKRGLKDASNQGKHKTYNFVRDYCFWIVFIPIPKYYESRVPLEHTLTHTHVPKGEKREMERAG